MYPGQQFDTEPGISAVVFAPAGQTALDALVLDLAAVLDGLVFEKFEIVVVQTTPTAGAAEKVIELAHRFPLLPLRALEGRFENEATALAATLATTRYDLIFVTSTDGQYEVRELNHLLDGIEQGADLAIGYRLNHADGLGWRLDRWSWNLLINVLFGPTARDVDCRFKLFRHAVWRRASMRPEGAATFFAELLIRARRLGFRVVEVPVSYRRLARAPLPGTAWRAVTDLFHLRARMQMVAPPANDPSWAGAASK